MDKIKSLVKKFRIPLIILLLVAASFSIYYLASAEEDIYANQIEVTNTSVNIIDGTPNLDGNFDSNDEAGNDSSDSNKIVRNFDSITYEVSYQLTYKENSTLSEEEKNYSNQRNVIIDVLIPTSLSATVSYDGGSDTNNGVEPVLIGNNSYYLYSFEVYEVDINSSQQGSIVISDINSTNGTEIKPIIRVRESTDEDAYEITESSTEDEINKITNVVESSVSVSAIEKYSIRLYSGVPNKDGTYSVNANIPVGIIIYLPTDTNKGIKGIQVPTKIDNANLTITDSISGSTISDDATIGDYDNTKYTVSGLDNLVTLSNNGKSGIDKDNVIVNNAGVSTFPLNYSELSYSNYTFNIDDDTINYPYISSKVFVFNVERNVNKDITYSIKLSTSSVSSNTVEINYNYDPYIGDYATNVAFVDTGNISNYDSDAIASGESVYNFNEEFYIVNTIKYGFSGTYSGDNLDGFTNYLKIDNDAIQLLTIENDSDLDYSIQLTGTESSSESTGKYYVSYGVGKWESSYFDINSNYCTISTKQDLMNYYGSPCVSPNDEIKWYGSLDEVEEAGYSLSDIILVEFDYFGDFAPGTKAVLTFKAKVINDGTNVGNTFSVVSRGITTWNDYDYYLSETPMPEVSNSYGNYNFYYTKTEYDSNYNIVSGTPNGTNGDTLLVSAFKAGFNEISVKNSYGGEKTTIYSGLDDPMEITITPVISTDLSNTIENVTIYVYLPTTMELYIKDTDRNPDSVESNLTEGEVSYNVYTYTFTREEIKENNYTVPNLIIHAYVSIDTPDNTSSTIKTMIVANVSDGGTNYFSVTSNEKRTQTKELILRNTNDISTLGSIDKTYIDKNGEFVYKMRAANLSGSSADLELLYMLPYSGDGIGAGSKFSGTISIALSKTLPSGYTVYYTTDNATTILSNELDSSKINWIEWTDYTTYINNATAIKIVSSSEIKSGEYFGSEEGISLNIKTSGNEEADIYYNNFYLLSKNSLLCNDADESEYEETNCTTSVTGVSVYPSNVSNVSVYNRKISGIVFVDEDYNGLYDGAESLLSNQIVELYKLSTTEEFDPKSPLSVISDSDEKVSTDTTTDNDGAYSFKSLESGNYYVKITFDCDKYTVTDKNVQSTSEDTTLLDSDFDMIASDESNQCSAVSNIVTLDNNTVSVKNTDLGLRIRQNFDISIKKYITNVTINSSSGTKSIDYDKETKVKIDVKNLKNTTLRVTYGFEIENTKYFPGTIGTIMESIPDGMTFDSSLPENDGWYETSNGTLYYMSLSNTLIMPGEKYYITIVLDLNTDEGGDYINVIYAMDLNVMSTTNSGNLNIVEIEGDIDDSDIESGSSSDEDDSDTEPDSSFDEDNEDDGWED